ncbi:hypothetical protein TNCV_1190421 [Trichonephila clavipes]|nr:hypothetical protein TNCV_1190421 [Trichonephila clavipes]
MDVHPFPRNSFKDLYLSSTQAMIRRKEEMVSELKTLQPYTRADCQDHKIPSTSVEEEINFEPSPPENENKIKLVSKPNKKKLCKKRKQKSKESTEEFIFPKKTARPISPTSTQDPIETNYSFSDLEQDVDHPPLIVTDLEQDVDHPPLIVTDLEQDVDHPPLIVKVTTELVTPKITPPPSYNA